MPRMMPLRLIVSLLLLVWSLPAVAQSDLLQAEEAFRFSVGRGEDRQIRLHWQIAEDYYLYRENFEARDAASGDIVMLRTGPGVVEADDANFGPSEVYYDEAVAHLAADAPGRVTVTYQGCKKDSICYPPLTLTLDTASLQASAPVIGFGAPAAPAANTNAGSFSLAGDTAGGGMVGSLLASGGAPWVIASFLAFGLLLSFTPCVLPMYPILSATLAREGEALTARRGFVLSSAYVLAMAAAFGMLGIAAAWSGHNLQMVLQSLRALYLWQGGFMIEAGVALALAYTLFRFRREARLALWAALPAAAAAYVAFFGLQLAAGAPATPLPVEDTFRTLAGEPWEMTAEPSSRP